MTGDLPIASCRTKTARTKHPTIHRSGERSVSEGLFASLKVIDCASYIAAPAAATVMSDFGAEVIKIEPPGTGDPYRTPGQPPAGNRAPVNPNWLVDSRNKKSLALNLASD